MYHSAKAADEAEAEFGNVFKKGGVPDDMPEAKAEKGELLIDFLVRTQTVASKSEAKRLIDQKGITMNEEVVSGYDQKAERGVGKVGKRKFMKVL